jgi:hypothetical protein
MTQMSSVYKSIATVRGTYMINIVEALNRLFRKKPFIVSITSAETSGKFENTEVTSHVFSAAIVCSLNKGREVARKDVLVGKVRLLYDGSCKYRTYECVSHAYQSTSFLLHCVVCGAWLLACKIT